MVNHFRSQPLPTSFMLASIIGLLIAALYIWPLSITWGFTLGIFFIICFLASVYNFTHAEGEEHLDIHDSKAQLRKSPLYK